MKNEYLHIRIDAELKKEFEELCKSDYKDMSEVVRDFILQRVRENRKKIIKTK